MKTFIAVTVALGLALTFRSAPAHHDQAGCVLGVCVPPIVSIATPPPPPPKAPCLGDGHSGYRVHLFYAQVLGETDNSSSAIGKIRVAADTVNQAYQQAGQQNVRWACTNGDEDVTHILVKDNTFSTLITTLKALGYNSTFGIYTGFESHSPNQFAGFATLDPDDREGLNNANNVGPAYSVVWSIADAGILMHEELHNMGAVQNSAPHSSGLGHCYDGSDVMCYNDGGPYFQNGGKMTYPCRAGSLATELDCNRDDYYNPSPPAGSYLATHWDTARSAWLAPM